MIPQGKAIGYECANGHVNDEHDSTRVSADRGSAVQGPMPACIECGAPLRRTLIPLLECQACGNVWAFSGDSDRPTCTNTECRSKNVERLADGD